MMDLQNVLLRRYRQHLEQREMNLRMRLRLKIELSHPATNENLRGVAILVPLNVLKAKGDEFHEDVISEPGAYTSTHDPQLLKLDFSSFIVVEPTVMAEAAEAGEYEHASSLVFPAATTTTTPFDTASATAKLNISLYATPPMLMLATHRDPVPLHLATT